MAAVKAATRSIEKICIDSPSCAGLTRLRGRSRFGAAEARASIHLRKNLPKRMDCRVKPGNDGEGTATATLRLIEMPEDQWRRGVSLAIDPMRKS